MEKSKPTSIDEYISGCAEGVRPVLQQIRATIKAAVPEAEETISYSIPAFKLQGRNLVYFAAYRKHIGLYPVPSGNSEFEKDFTPYKTSGKGAIQFPLDKPMPLKLIERIVKFRVKETRPKTSNP